MSKFTELQQAINEAHNPELAEQTGHVYQIWSDGEITMQKSGDLLWQRNLHCMSVKIALIDEVVWPCELGKNEYAFVTEQDAKKIRQLIGECAIINIKSLMLY